MNKFQDKLILLHVVLLPYAEGQMTLNTNACDVQVGIVLLQEQPAKARKPFEYLSRSLTRAKSVYDRT